MCASEGGARLRCVFQKMEGKVTREGLWLTSTATNTVNDRFHVTAASLERTAREAASLSPTGKVEVAGKVVQFRRPDGEGELRVELAVDSSSWRGLRCEVLLS